MSVETLSFTLRCWRESESDASLLQVSEVDGGQMVVLAGGSFIVRVGWDRAGAVTRCVIRHPASGREAHVQGGPDLHAFARECLLNEAETEGPHPTEQEGESQPCITRSEQVSRRITECR
jgi:hypothetical protein